MGREKIIWQPELHAIYDFRVLLDRDIAKEMARSTRVEGKDLNKAGNEYLNALGVKGWRDPYRFYKDTSLLSQIYLGDGISLSTDEGKIESLLEDPDSSQENIKYLSEVRYDSDVYKLMFLFSKWIWHANIIAGKE